MNKKWHFASLLLFLCIAFGVFQEQKNIANQEIVLEFIDTKINENTINLTIIDVKQKLSKIGATSIEIKETNNGKLKISYHSILAVHEIENALTNKNLLKNNQKENKFSTDYHLDIYELTDENESSGLAHKNIIEIKFNSDRFTIDKITLFQGKVKLEKANYNFKTSYKANKNLVFSKKNTTRSKPEVRAGPTYFLS